MKSFVGPLALITLAAAIFATSSPSQEQQPMESGPVLKVGAQYSFIYPTPADNRNPHSIGKILSAPRGDWVEVEIDQQSIPPAPPIQALVNLKHVIRIYPYPVPRPDEKGPATK